MPQHRLPHNLVAGLAGLSLAAFTCSQVVEAGPESTRSAHGVLRSVGEATLSSDISAHVRGIPFRDGQTFKKGDVLVQFDCDRFQAELNVAQAEWRGQLATYENSVSLLKLKAAGALEVAIARAQADKGEATVEVAKVRVAQCRILAPFNGRVVEMLTHEHDTPAANAPLLRIVDHANIEVDMILPSNSLVWLREEATFEFQIQETGTTVPGRITRIGAAVDPVSQTLKIVGALFPAANEAGKVLPGMSGNAVFTGLGEK